MIFFLNSNLGYLQFPRSSVGISFLKRRYTEVQTLLVGSDELIMK